MATGGIDYSWITPELANNPGVAVNVMQSQDPHQLGTVASLGIHGANTADAIADHMASNDSAGFWNNLGNTIFNNPIGHTVLSGLELLNKPLKEVQRDYKFIHSVYKKHGLLAGFLTTAGTIAGGVIGSFAGPEGTILGAGLAATATRKLLGDKFQDSYADSENEDYKVSAGRDFSNALASIYDVMGADGAARVLRDTDRGIGKLVSGSFDTVANFRADPFMVISKFNMLMKNGKYLKASKNEVELQVKYPMMKVIPGAKQFLEAHSGRVFNPNQMDAVRNGGILNATSRTYNRALDKMESIITKAAEENPVTKTVKLPSGKTTEVTAKQIAAGQIATEFPELGAATAARIAEYKTADEIHNFLRDAVYFDAIGADQLAGRAVLPSRTLMREKGLTPLQKALRGDNLSNQEQNWLRKGYATFSGYMPYSLNKALMELSTQFFKWNSPDATSVIYRIARFGMGHSTAVEMAGKYAEAIATNSEEGLALAKAIFAQTKFEAFKGMGLPDESAFVANVKRELDSLNKPSVGRERYTNAPDGADNSSYVTLDGSRATAGVSPWQATDTFEIPNFLAVKRELREAGKFTKLYGKMDEFVAGKYTNSIFKPLALATAGFGLRVAASEMLPAFARYGFVNMFKAKLAASTAKQYVKLAKEEEPHFMSAVMVTLGAGKTGVPMETIKEGFPAFKQAVVRGMAKILPEEQLDLAIQLVAAHDGHLVNEIVGTGKHSASDRYDTFAAADVAFQNETRKLQYRTTGDYTTYESSSPHFLPTWKTLLGRESKTAMGKNIAGDISQVFHGLDKVTLEKEVGNMGYEEYQKLRDELIMREYDRIMLTKAGDYLPYKEESQSLRRWIDQHPIQFASDRVDHILSLVIGKDGTYHSDIAQMLSKGESPELKKLAEIDPLKTPAALSGEIVQAYMGGKNPLAWIVNVGFKRAIDPIINGLVREPLYLTHVAEEFQSFKYLIAKGQLTEGQALRMAEYRASHAMLPQIHNTSLRTQFAQLARNFLPFYFAQEQALKRAFNLLKDTSIGSPVFSRGFRMYQMVEQTLNNPAYIQEDANGNKYINFPLVGEWGKNLQGALNAFGVPMVSALPISVQGNLSSLKTVLPEIQPPGVSPFAAISANIIFDHFPFLSGTTRTAMKDTLGMSADRGIVDLIVPAQWMKSAWSAMNPNEQDVALVNAVTGALAAAYYHGQTPDANSSAQERQEFIDRIYNNARSILMIKAALNLLSPLAPKVEQTDVGFSDEWHKLLKKYGNYSDAMLQFLGEHGDKAVSYTVAKTQTSVLNARFPYTQKAIDFIDSNLQDGGLLKDSKYSTAAMYLVPQDPGPGNSLAIHQELVRQHIRSQRTPQEFLDQFYIAQGNNEIAPLREQHTQIMNQAKAFQSSFLQQQESDRWSSIMTKMQHMNPIWYDDYRGGKSMTNAQVVITQLQELFMPGNVQDPRTEQSELVKSLMNDYEVHMQRMNQYNQLGISGQMLQMEKDNWQTYLDNKKVEDPRLQTIINSVFSKVD